MKILSVHEGVVPISSSIRNAWIDFSSMDCSIVAVVSDVVRDGKPVVGYGFNSNGRYSAGEILRRPDPAAPARRRRPRRSSTRTAHLDPAEAWDLMMRNEKPGGHGERSRRGRRRRHGAVRPGRQDRRAAAVPLPRPTDTATASPTTRCSSTPPAATTPPARACRELQDEMRGFLDQGYRVVKMKIGGARPGRGPQAHRGRAGRSSTATVPAGGRRQRPVRPATALEYAQGDRALQPVLVRGGRRPAGLRPERHPVRALQGPHRHRGEPVLPAGRPQPDPLRRDAPRPRHHPGRPRPELRADRVPADPGHARASTAGRPAAASRTAGTSSPCTSPRRSSSAATSPTRASSSPPAGSPTTPWSSTARSGSPRSPASASRARPRSTRSCAAHRRLTWPQLSCTRVFDGVSRSREMMMNGDARATPRPVPLRSRARSVHAKLTGRARRQLRTPARTVARMSAERVTVRLRPRRCPAGSPVRRAAPRRRVRLPRQARPRRRTPRGRRADGRLVRRPPDLRRGRAHRDRRSARRGRLSGTAPWWCLRLRTGPPAPWPVAAAAHRLGGRAERLLDPDHPRAAGRRPRPGLASLGASRRARMGCRDDDRAGHEAPNRRTGGQDQHRRTARRRQRPSRSTGALTGRTRTPRTLVGNGEDVLELLPSTIFRMAVPRDR